MLGVYRVIKALSGVIRACIRFSEVCVFCLHFCWSFKSSTRFSEVCVFSLFFYNVFGLLKVQRVLLGFAGLDNGVHGGKGGLLSGTGNWGMVDLGISNNKGYFILGSL